MLDRGVWHRYLLHVKFSSDPGVAFQEVYRDGQLVLPKTSTRYANMTTAKLYLKVGMYRKATNNGSMVVWHDDMAIYSAAPTISVTPETATSPSAATASGGASTAGTPSAGTPPAATPPGQDTNGLPPDVVARGVVIVN